MTKQLVWPDRRLQVLIVYGSGNVFITVQEDLKERNFYFLGKKGLNFTDKYQTFSPFMDTSTITVFDKSRDYSAQICWDRLPCKKLEFKEEVNRDLSGVSFTSMRVVSIERLLNVYVRKEKKRKELVTGWVLLLEFTLSIHSIKLWEDFIFVPLPSQSFLKTSVVFKLHVRETVTSNP